MKLTSEQIMEVPCKERGSLRKRYPILPTGEGLTATDKAVLVYYAFVMLCDSCSANAEKLFGKAMSSQDIQRSFAQHALAECRKDGVISK